METYTLLKAPEEVKLVKMRIALKCLAAHLWISKDSVGYIWPFNFCDGCDQANLCRKFKLVIEKEMN